MTENDIQTTSVSDRERAIRSIKVLLFSASIVPSAVGGAIAASTGVFEWTPFLLAAVGLFIGQAGGDYLYYYMTHFHTDARDAHTKIFAGWRPLFTGTLFKPEQTVWAGALCLLIDLAIAIYFFLLLGTAILWFALAGGLIAIFFTPLMLRGLKEPVIFVTFGPLCVAGIVFALTGQVSEAALVASLPVGFFVTVVAYLKSARFDVVDSGGEQVVLKLSRTVILVLLSLGYVSLVAGVALSYLPMWSLVGLLSLPLAWSVATIVRQSSSKVSEYLWATVRSIVILVVVGAGLAAGFLA
jgi:1,4-dihydroxy-2-naphthoate octaprenyltransferase